MISEKTARAWMILLGFYSTASTRASNHCLRYIDAYRKGLSGSALEYSVKKFKGHRTIPSSETYESLQRAFDALSQEQKLKIFGGCRL